MAGQLTLAELRAEAEAMGLGGDDIVNFVYKQQELYRNERAEERAVREAERAEKAAEAERVERVAEIEGLSVRCVLQMHWRGRETKRESMKFVC